MALLPSNRTAAACPAGKGTSVYRHAQSSSSRQRGAVLCRLRAHGHCMQQPQTPGIRQNEKPFDSPVPGVGWRCNTIPPRGCRGGRALLPVVQSSPPSSRFVHTQFPPSLVPALLLPLPWAFCFCFPSSRLSYRSALLCSAHSALACVAFAFCPALPRPLRCGFVSSFFPMCMPFFAWMALAFLFLLVCLSFFSSYRIGLRCTLPSVLGHGLSGVPSSSSLLVFPLRASWYWLALSLVSPAVATTCVVLLFAAAAPRASPRFLHSAPFTYLLFPWAHTHAFVVVCLPSLPRVSCTPLRLGSFAPFIASWTPPTRPSATLKDRGGREPALIQKNKRTPVPSRPPWILYERGKGSEGG